MLKLHAVTALERTRNIGFQSNWYQQQYLLNTECAENLARVFYYRIYLILLQGKVLVLFLHMPARVRCQND